MLTSEDIERLCRPFEANAHEFFSGFCYIAEEEVTDRLDEVDPSWSFEIQSVKRDGIGNQQCIVVACMTVKDVRRSSTGMQMIEYRNKKDGAGKSEIEAGEGEKAATTDALRRCARLFGIGRYILKMGTAVKDKGQLEGWLKKNYPPAPAAPKAPPPQSTTTNGNGTTPPPAVLMHWSKDAVKMNWLIGDCVDKGFLEPGQTEKDLLELIERDDFLDFPTCKEHAVPAIAAHIKARYDLAEMTRQPAPPARPMRYQHNVTEATFDTRTEDITFMVPAEPTKKELFKPLVVKRSFFLAKLTHGETNDRLNGEAQAEAMMLDKWNTSSPLASSHSFPEVQLDYDALINGTARLTLMAARPTTNWLNKPKSETLTNGGENDDIPATAVSPHYRKRADAQPMAGGD